ncbi:MAG: hydroxymethylbilane synthase [Nocardioidaceae bacterium]
MSSVLTATLRVGTRASVLATTQARIVADAIAAATGRAVELVPVTTQGDTDRRPLAELGGQGVFVSALRESLVRGDVDVAVHSYKDLPTAAAGGIALGAVPSREDPRDVVVARDGLTLAELPTGARVGTGSPRRAAQVRALGLGLDVVSIRGNVDTRLGKVASGDYDAVLLARAGLARLGRLDVVTEVLDPLQILPAPAQGALACEVREDDAETLAALATLDDPASRTSVAAERSVLTTLEAGCSAPVGALADVALGEDGDEIWLRAVVVDISGAPAIRRSASGPVDDPIGVGARLAAQMLVDGAASLMARPPSPEEEVTS